jgi:hypothetical protein
LRKKENRFPAAVSFFAAIEKETASAICRFWSSAVTQSIYMVLQGKRPIWISWFAWMTARHG